MLFALVSRQLHRLLRGRLVGHCFGLGHHVRRLVARLRGAARRLRTNGEEDLSQDRARLLAEWHWEEGRQNPSRGVTFDVRGARTFEYVDRDMDGRDERSSFYDRRERVETYDRQGRAVREGRDRDDDGRWDELRVPAGESRESLLMRDDDGDGHFESRICDGEPRAIRCP